MTSTYESISIAQHHIQKVVKVMFKCKIRRDFFSVRPLSVVYLVRLSKSWVYIRAEPFVIIKAGRMCEAAIKRK